MSSENCPTVLIKPTHPSQGDFVVINAQDFDSAKGHVLYVAPGIKVEEVAVADNEVTEAILSRRGRKQPEGA